jgi:GxxExxY protein
MRDESRMLELCDEVRQAAFELHRFLRCGHLERVYEKGLANRLNGSGLRTRQQVPLQVRDEDGTVLGDFFADLLVEEELIVEVKACDALHGDHTAQVLGYLRASGRRDAMLINFGAPRLQVRKLIT